MLNDIYTTLPWVIWLLMAVLIALSSGLLIRALIKRYQHTGRIDEPNQRSMHSEATPTGAGIVVVLFLGLASLYIGLHWLSFQFLSTMIIVVALGIVGWLDDKNHLSVSSRLIVFFILSILIVLAIGIVDEIKFGQHFNWIIPYPIAAILTVFGFIWLLNLYNFMDGLDGLAGMQTVIAASAFLILFGKIAFFSGAFFDAFFVSSGYALLCLVLISATIGFLIWNWSPAKIFLGDVGSLPIGGFFALCTIVAVKQLNVSLLSCVLILGVFIFDASYTLIARFCRGEKVTEAHRSHIYQRLASAGVAHSSIVLRYSLIMLLFSVAAILWEWHLINGLVASVFALIGVIFMLIWVRVLERKQL